MSMVNQPSVTITSLFHDVVQRSSVSVIWGDNLEMRLDLPLPYGCALEDIQAEAEKALRELSRISRTIPVLNRQDDGLFAGRPRFGTSLGAGADPFGDLHRASAFGLGTVCAPPQGPGI